MSPSPIALLRGCFVTGTDTEIGKTCVSGGLVHAFRQRGLRAAAIKPLAAGQQQLPGRSRHDHVAELRGIGLVPMIVVGVPVDHQVHVHVPKSRHDTHAFGGNHFRSSRNG